MRYPVLADATQTPKNGVSDASKTTSRRLSDDGQTLSHTLPPYPPWRLSRRLRRRDTLMDSKENQQ